MKSLVYLAPIALLSCGIALAQATSPTPPGDTRDQSGNTVAPDGSVTPKGANTVKKQSGSQQSQQSPSSMSNPQGKQANTPPGDTRDQSGNTVAPDGTDTPRGTNTFGKPDDNSTVPPNGASTQSDQGTSATPTGDRRDRYGDTVAPDGATTPRGANTPKSQPDSTTQPSAPDNSK